MTSKLNSKPIIKSFLLLAYFFLLTPLTAQLDSLEKQLIEATLEYRNHLHFKNENPKAFENLMNKWTEIETNDTIVQTMFLKTYYWLVQYEAELEELKKSLQKLYPTSPLPNSITEVDRQIFLHNLDLISFMFAKYINPEYPNKVRLDTFNLHEIDFIDVQPGELIADIGSSLGDHILLLSLIYPNNDFILNDILYFFEDYLNDKLKRNNQLFIKNNRSIRVVKGKKKDINLGEKVDKIIIRNAFHHFKKKKKMLKSIAEHLNEDGTVIFIEPLKNNNTSIDDCKLKMERSEVLPHINKSDLIIVEEKVINNTLFLSCKAKKKN